MHIMDDMSGRKTTLLGVAGAAALGIFIKWRQVRKARAPIMLKPATVRSPRRINIDDDAAAEIIKRARPEFERARELYAY
jgi:hypothetical protein